MVADRGIWSFPDGGHWSFADRTRILGILNVTPDSFSDAGQFLDPPAAIARGLEMADEGADALDVGGESTRPGSQPVPDEAQIERVTPVIRALRDRLDARAQSPASPQEKVRISVDTSRAAVAAAALDAGAEIVNDVTGLRGDPAMAPLLTRRGAAAILMHMRGIPSSMQEDSRYEDVLSEVGVELRRCLQVARDAGMRDDRIVLDPGIGFGKTWQHNLRILARLSSLAATGRPLLIGVSRKSFLGKLTGLPVDQRLEASLAAGAVAILNGASILRVHDVAASVRMVRVVDAIRRAGHEGPGREYR